MSARRTLATSRRVLLQLRHDPRTIALLLLVPCALETLLRLIYAHRRAVSIRWGRHCWRCSRLPRCFS